MSEELNKEENTQSEGAPAADETVETPKEESEETKEEELEPDPDNGGE